MRRLLAALAFAFLLTTAGCSAIADLGGTETPTTGADAVPGVENDRLANETVLLDTHQAALVEQGFVTDIRVNATAEQRTRDGRKVGRVQRNQQTTVVAGGTGYTFSLTNAGTGARFDEWANESYRATRLQSGDQTTYREGQPRDATQLAGTSILQSYLTEEFTVESVEETDGRTLVTLTSTTVPDEEGAVPENATDVRDYEATLVVDTEGRVHSLEVTAAYTIQGEEATLLVSYDLQRTGVESVTRPEWVENAG